MFDNIRESLHFLRLDPPTRIARRTLSQGLRKGFLSGLKPLALPSMLRLVLEQGVGTHMIHGLWASTVPDRVAIQDARSSLTYEQMDRDINKLANALALEIGVGKRTPVVLMMENRCEYVVSWIASMRLGASAVHASYRFRPEELYYQVMHSRARVIIVDEERLPVVEQMLAEFDIRHPVTVVVVGALRPVPRGAFLDWRGLLELGNASAPVRDGEKLESANVVYTSGTTGKPKGAVRDFTAFGAAELFRILERLDVRAGDRHLIVAPLYHSGAQAFCLMQAALGATIVLEPHFDAEQTLRALSEHQIHSIFMVPTMIRRILELDASVHALYPTPHLRAVVSGAAPFPQALREKAIVRFGAEHLFDFYGATELGWVTLIRGDEMLARPGSVGRAVAGQELGIFSEEGKRLPVGEVGLVHVRNQQTMQGYLDNKEATDATRKGAWVGVEDLGRLDEAGYLYIEGRARDMIISGGVNIYPVEIEEVLARHPDILEVAVVGVPDEDFGERLVCCYVSDGGDVLDEGMLAEFVREQLARFKVPRQWARFDVLPRNPTGKVLKRALREVLTATTPESREEE
jgi:fatty-acyl-CoA synthase